MGIPRTPSLAERVAQILPCSCGRQFEDQPYRDLHSADCPAKHRPAVLQELTAPPALPQDLKGELDWLKAELFANEAKDPTPCSSLIMSAIDRTAAIFQARREWRLIESAPMDGTKIDLLFPHPRGRQIDCFWDKNLFWTWRVPKFKAGELLPESEWDYSTYPNLQPTHWLPTPPKEPQG